MDKKIRNTKFFLILFSSFILLTLSSCSNFWENDKASSNPVESKTTFTFTGKIELSGNIPVELLENKNPKSRAALPQPIDISSGSDFEYYVTAEMQNGETLISEVDPDERTFELNLCYGKWTIETGIRRISDEEPILNDIFQTNISVENPIFAHSFFLTPVYGGDGTIKLDMQVPASIENLVVKIIQKPANSTLSFDEPLTKSEDTITIVKNDVPSGTYVFELNFYDSDYIAFSTVQTINVLTGLETSKWVSGATSELLSTGNFVLTDELISVWRSKRTAYYVDSVNGNDSNSGSPADPLKTLRKAVSYVNDMDYAHIICVERNFSQEISEPIEIQRNLTINIYGSDTTKTPVLSRAAESTAEELLNVTGTAQLTLAGLSLNGTEDCGIKIADTAKLILNSGTISECGTGIDNYGALEVNGGTVTECTTGINIDTNSSINISGGNILGSNVNLKLPIGKKITIDKQIKEGTQVSVTLDGDIKKINNSGINNTIFTSGYGIKNPTIPPYTYFKSDAGYVLSYGTGSTTEAEIALSGEKFFNAISDVTVSFEVDKKHINPDSFKNGTGDVTGNTVTVTPKVLIKNHSTTTQISDIDELKLIDENLSWELGLYYRGVKLPAPATVSADGFYHTNKLIPYGAAYKDRYDFHVQMTFLGIKHDAEFVIMGSNTRSIGSEAELISTLSDLQSSGDTLDVKIVLTKDLDFSDSSLSKPYLDRFDGTFDGNGHTIILNKIDNESTAAWTRYLGICSTNFGIIQNVIIEHTGADIQLNQGSARTEQGIYDGCGPICQTNYGIIRNCWNKVSFKPSTSDTGYFQRMGGLVMYNLGTIENCLNTADLYGNFNKNYWAGWYGFLGGIAGQNGNGGTPGIIKNCVNYGIISMRTEYKSSSSINGAPGAIIGYQENSKSIVQNCYFVKDCVRGNTDSYGTATVQNWLTYGGSMNSGFNAGSFIANGYFEMTNSNPSLTSFSGDALRKSNLLTALNDYVDEKNANDPSANLKKWKSVTIDGKYYVVLE